MQNEMVDRAKVAALVALAEHGQTTDLQEALVNGDGRGSLKPGALDAMIRAAIVAMRIPTEVMVTAGVYSDDLVGLCTDAEARPKVRSIFQAAIDAALLP